MRYMGFVQKLSDGGIGRSLKKSSGQLRAKTHGWCCGYAVGVVPGVLLFETLIHNEDTKDHRAPHPGA